MKVINPLKGKTDKSCFFEKGVYESEGIIRAIKANGGTGNQPKVIEYDTNGEYSEDDISRML